MTGYKTCDDVLVNSPDTRVLVSTARHALETLSMLLDGDRRVVKLEINSNLGTTTLTIESDDSETSKTYKIGAGPW